LQHVLEELRDLLALARLGLRCLPRRIGLLAEARLACSAATARSRAAFSREYIQDETASPITSAAAIALAAAKTSLFRRTSF
jgi:hypothetical protein